MCISEENDKSVNNEYLVQNIRNMKEGCLDRENDEYMIIKRQTNRDREDVCMQT